MRKLFLFLHALWYGMSHPFDSQEKREEYANKEAWKYLKRTVK